MRSQFGSLGTSPRTLVLLAPTVGEAPETFQEVRRDPRPYRNYLAAMQRLRGSLYLQDGAIEPHQLTPDGRHCLPSDELSWHMLVINNENGQVVGCARYQEHRVNIEYRSLGIHSSAQAQ